MIPVSIVHKGRIALVFALLALLVSCQTMPEQGSLVMRASRILVLPADSIYKDLNTYSLPIQQEFRRQLQDEGYQVIAPDAKAFAGIQDEALLVSGSVYDPQIGKLMPLRREVYLKAIIDLCTEKYDHEVVIMPELVLRTAVIEGDLAKWDDAEREITFAIYPDETYQLPSRINGLSIRTSVYTRKGAKVLSGYNGLSLPYEVSFRQSLPNEAGYNKMIPEFPLKENIVSDNEKADAVEKSLAAFYLQVLIHDD